MVMEKPTIMVVMTMKCEGMGVGTCVVSARNVSM